MSPKLALIAATLVVTSACTRPADATATTPSIPSAAPAPAARSAIARLVFVDLEDACACTRERIEQCWAALQQALGDPARYPVERIHLDSQAALAEPWLKARPLEMEPALYFVDGQGAVREQLQGAFTSEQIQAVLSAH